MRRWLSQIAAAALVALALGGCGAPEELSRDQARDLATARERLDDAIDTEETLRTSRKDALRLRAEVRRIVSGGSFESATLDEFGLAALGELQLAVPSLVEIDGDGIPKALDRRATRAFLRFALTDPQRALIGPARDEVRAIEATVEDSEAGGDTRASEDETVEAYLRAAEGDLKPIWPHLAERLRTAREDL